MVSHAPQPLDLLVGRVDNALAVGQAERLLEVAVGLGARGAVERHVQRDHPGPVRVVERGAVRLRREPGLHLRDLSPRAFDPRVEPLSRSPGTVSASSAARARANDSCSAAACARTWSIDSYSSEV